MGRGVNRYAQPPFLQAININLRWRAVCLQNGDLFVGLGGE
jgi:hypothetical protein